MSFEKSLNLWPETKWWPLPPKLELLWKRLPWWHSTYVCRHFLPALIICVDLPGENTVRQDELSPYAGCNWYIFQMIHLTLKGQLREIFLSKVISPRVSYWSPDSWSKAVKTIDSNSLRNATSKVLLRYGPLRRILLGAMGHYEKWGNTVKICEDSRAMGHSTGLGYALWALVQDSVICYGP